MSAPRITIVLCQTGLARHAPAAAKAVAEAGGELSTVECFDRCETCERWLLARVDGAMTRFRTHEELVEALGVLAASEE